MAKYRGTGTVLETDYHSVKWVGKTKGGSAVTIIMEKAINMGAMDWAFAEKNETVAQVVFTGVYQNTDEPANETTEPWTITIDGEPTGAAEIILGAGLFYLDDACIGLTRGGGSFSRGATFRNINADGDRGPVEGRVTIDDVTPTLTMNTLQILRSVTSLYPGIEKVTEEQTV